MTQVIVPLQPRTLVTVDGVAIQADPSAPLHGIGLVGLCWFLVSRYYPDLTWPARLALTLVWTLLFLAVFLLHSLGHISSARMVGASMDALLINAAHWATLYYDNNILPEAHLGRAAGGPLANLGGIFVGRFLRAFLPPGPFGRDLADTFVLINLLIGSASLLPAPMMDGGSLVKWGVYRQTGDYNRANLVVRYLGLRAAFGLSGGAALALFLRRRLLGAALAALGLVTALESLRRD